MYLVAPAGTDGVITSTAPAAGPGTPQTSVRLYAGWKMVGKSVTFFGDCRWYLPTPMALQQPHLLPCPAWCPALSPRFRRAERQLVGGREEGVAENGKSFNLPRTHSSPSERKA